MNYKKFYVNVDGEEIECFKVNYDSYGNPRYVFHFLHLNDDYATACKLANDKGGRKYTAKWYGGGIVIQSYNFEKDLTRMIEYAKEAV